MINQGAYCAGPSPRRNRNLGAWGRGHRRRGGGGNTLDGG